MPTFLYINADETKKDRATALGCGWMPSVPAHFASVATAPCVILNGAGQTVVLPEPTTKAAVAVAAAPLIAAEQAAQGAEAIRNTNADVLRSKAQAALSTNDAFLAVGNAATAAQVRTQTLALTKECSALIRLLLNQLDTTSGT